MGVEIEPGGDLALRHSVLLLNFQQLGVVDRRDAVVFLRQGRGELTFNATIKELAWEYVFSLDSRLSPL